jgi:hypothetical protein
MHVASTSLVLINNAHTSTVNTPLFSWKIRARAHHLVKSAVLQSIRGKPCTH